MWRLVKSWITKLFWQVVASLCGLAWSLLPEVLCLAPSFCLVWQVICLYLSWLSPLELASSSRVCFKLLHTSFINIDKSSVVSGQGAVFKMVWVVFGRFFPEELVLSVAEMAEQFCPSVACVGGCLAVLVDHLDCLVLVFGIVARLNLSLKTCYEHVLLHCITFINALHIYIYIYIIF